MKDKTVACHLTFTSDGWSNDRVESIYSFNVIFPERRAILLKALDLSKMVHNDENLASMYPCQPYIGAMQLCVNTCQQTLL